MAIQAINLSANPTADNTLSRLRLSPKRLELLRHLHRNPARTIHALAAALGRDYRRVHEDVEALEAADLLERDKAGVRADYEAFDMHMKVAL